MADTSSNDSFFQFVMLVFGSATSSVLPFLPGSETLFLNFGCDIDAPFGRIMELDKLRIYKFLAQDVALFCLDVSRT